MHDLEKGLLLFAVSAVGWMGIFELSVHSLARLSRSRGWKLSHHHIMNISNAVLSSTQVGTLNHLFTD